MHDLMNRLNIISAHVLLAWLMPHAHLWQKCTMPVDSRPMQNPDSLAQSRGSGTTQWTRCIGGACAGASYRTVWSVDTRRQGLYTYSKCCV